MWLLMEKKAAIQIQSSWRAFLPKRNHRICIEMATRIQSLIRAYLIRTKLEKWSKASIYIQKVWRGFWAQLEYQMDLLDIIAVQSLARKRIARKERIRALDAIM